MVTIVADIVFGDSKIGDYSRLVWTRINRQCMAGS